MKPKKIDETAGRVGVAMRGARNHCNLSLDDAARLLWITPAELYEYERGAAQIPMDVFCHIFTLAYNIMHARVLENTYRRQRGAFRKIGRSVVDS